MADIRCPLHEAALISKHERAVVSEERDLLFYELDDLASLVAARLREAGCKEGARIGLFLNQDWRYIALFFGIVRAGCVACPMNSKWPADRGLALFRSIGADTIIARVDDARRRALSDVTILDPDALLSRTAVDRPFNWSQHMPLDRPATIIFTSGSAGEPKPALLTYGNHYYSARGSNVNIRIRTGDRWLLSLPLYHVGGIGVLFRCILSGATIAIPESGEPVLDAVGRMRATHLSLVEAQLYRLVRDAGTGQPLRDLKAVLLGGGAIPPSSIKRALELKVPIYPSYGLTEMSSQVCTVLPDSPPAKRYTSGKVLRNREIRISAEGEICVRGETLFKGYVDGDKIIRSMDDEGWFHTGDLGVMDAEGYLNVTGRLDNMFVSGGENIQPEEIEKVLLACDGVEACIVVSVADKEFGRRPVAFVKGVTDLKSHAERELPRFKIPDAFLPWPEDMATDGKPDRSALAAIAARALRRG